MNKVMVVDDNPLDHMITKHVLKTGYAFHDVLVMESAVAALAHLELHKDNLAEWPFLIILDLDMPGLNGIGFLEKFELFAAEIKNSCKIVVLTASEVLSDLELMKTNPNVYKLIAKPLRYDALNPIFQS